MYKLKVVCLPIECKLEKGINTFLSSVIYIAMVFINGARNCFSNVCHLLRNQMQNSSLLIS